MMEGPCADSEEKREPAGDIDTVVVDGLKVLDPKRPIREADIKRFAVLSSTRASLSTTCEALGWSVLSFLNLSGKQPLSHFEIGLNYLWIVCVPSTLNKLSRFNEIVH
jgi:hypothetical protein